ncbi:MAG TPA: DUF1643 domain-containing protein [Gemmatimonadaceae bacterium]|nr:DUF1643 domain-containing protein [Gemmatimonadaceae bacterium]
MSAPALFDDVEKAAVISECGTYRYTLERRWGDGPAVLFVMLNPSTADAEQDDPTIRRCIGFARSWGYDALLVGNLHAFRSTSPLDLAFAGDPVGPRNGEALAGLRDRAARVVVAWGASRYAHAVRVNRARAILGKELYALGTTANGAPRHPLYMPASAVPIPWSPSCAGEGEQS